MPGDTTVVTIVSSPDRDRLSACLGSVQAQTSSGWQHIVVCDDSCEASAMELVERHAADDDRVVVLRSAVTSGLVDMYNAAVDAAAGPLLLLLNAHDEMAHDAVARLSAPCSPTDGMAYADHDVGGTGLAPFHKPDFSPELLRNTNYIARPFVAALDLVRSVGGFRDGFDAAIEYDLVLRLTERASTVRHVAEVLYHERAVATPLLPATSPTAASLAEAATAAGQRAVTDHCERVGIDATVETSIHAGCYRLRRRPRSSPLVSVIIPTRGSTGPVWGVSRSFVVDAVASLVDLATYQELEFVVVHDDATPDAVLRALQRAAGTRLRLVPFHDEFNFSAKINAGVADAAGDLLLILNDDTELIEPESIATMVAHLDADDVGMVGAKLLFADGTMQHGGHIYNGGPMHACFGWRGDSPGPLPLRPLAVERECSGVTAAAALVKRSVFDAVGGFETDLALNYNDVDFCLKVRAAGQRIVWTPYASWYHFESQTRESRVLPEEQSFIEHRWHDEMHDDPYYNQNLTAGRHDWLERP